MTATLIQKLCDRAWNWLGKHQFHDEVDFVEKVMFRGRVGIGIANPLALLSIHDGEATDIAAITLSNLSSGEYSSTHGALIALSVHKLYIANREAGEIYFWTSNACRMAILADGKVGIGTTTPTSILQVVGIPTYANNAAAVAAGLTAGAFYRTGGDPDVICAVH
ncbi:MAG: hypothetical protein LAP85_20325 [Acidobacteriia bacterium]|nr:hypothetical protein [Terriglobia bacterium]